MTTTPSSKPDSKFYTFKPLDKSDNPVPLEKYAGKVVLIFNSASKCGFTPQLEGLEKLYKEIKSDAKNAENFEMLGFPCNQFGGQDPGSNEEIQEFCMLNYGVTFPMLAKTEVNGANVDPLWDWMKNEQPGILGLTRVKWNFEKFLIGKDGKVKARWASTTKPESIKGDIMKALAQ